VSVGREEFGEDCEIPEMWESRLVMCGLRLEALSRVESLRWPMARASISLSPSHGLEPRPEP